MWLKVFLTSLLVSITAVFQPTPTDVNDFDYASWQSEYDISLDEQGRSIVRVKETVVADFPDFDQNRGIIRSIPAELDNIKLTTRVISVTDENGAPVHYETEKEDGWIYLLLGTDEYLHGPNTFVIEYEMRDALVHVKNAREDTGKGTSIDEFYWNLLPLESSQAIEKFNATITFSPELADATTGKWVCYEGLYGSITECAPEMITVTNDKIEIESGYRVAGKGVTIAVGFNPGTIKQPLFRTNPALFLGGSGAAWAIGALLGFGANIAKIIMVRKARKNRGTIIPQYEVPAELSPLIAAQLMPRPKKSIAAHILHLAVNGILTVFNAETKRGRPTLQINSDAQYPHSFDSKVVTGIFRGKTTLKIPSQSTEFATNMTALKKTAKTEAETMGLTEKRASKTGRTLFITAASFMLLSVLINLSATLFGATDGLMMAVLPAVFGVVILGLTLTGSRKTYVLTTAGAQAYEHLQGVKMFIGVAEAERIRMLQSAQGATAQQQPAAQQQTVGTPLHLYEKLLPYAVLFGQETSWGKVLETAYQATGTAPLWFVGDPTRPFTTQMRNLTNTTESSVNYGTSSSSGGGSSGGGFSGGGGGGGFSGGR